MSLESVDPRLQPNLIAELERRRGRPIEGLPRGVTVVLAGHRAAGKTSLLPFVAQRLGRPGFDLDAELQTTHQRSLSSWVENDEPDFRRAERARFRELPQGAVVAVGGGFLANHLEALSGTVVVEVPISFETYVERLRHDTTRGRLLKGLSLDEELEEIYFERERRHAAARPMSLVDFLLKLEVPLRARRVVTLPPGAPTDRFAWAARHAGAELLELRTDLHPEQLDVLGPSRALPLLVATRGPRLPDAWRTRAAIVDDPDSTSSRTLHSFHAPQPLSTEEALARWRTVSAPAAVKHVEPLGDPSTFARLLRTQAGLIERFGAEHVTVLCTGPLAMPFRAVLSQRNALDFLALDGSWSAAPGQRLLADAVIEARASRVDGATERLGLLGTSVGASRSTRLHRAPFDRISLPADAPVDTLVEALRPHYRGLAITSPFKKRLARDGFAAVNTLSRAESRWVGENTDLLGARAVLERLSPRVIVLGDGGVTEALRLAAKGGTTTLEILRRAEVSSAPLRGDVVWTWPFDVEPPPGLTFDGARVVVVTYGAKARPITRWISERGGTPLKLGHTWLVAQARRQRELWGEDE